MFLNLVYNWVFDQIDARAGRIYNQRSQVGRIFHAIGFELMLVATSLPIYVWWLDSLKIHFGRRTCKRL